MVRDSWVRPRTSTDNLGTGLPPQSSPVTRPTAVPYRRLRRPFRGPSPSPTDHTEEPPPIRPPGVEKSRDSRRPYRLVLRKDSHLRPMAYGTGDLTGGSHVFDYDCTTTSLGLVSGTKFRDALSERSKWSMLLGWTRRHLARTGPGRLLPGPVSRTWTLVPGARRDPK